MAARGAPPRSRRRGRGRHFLRSAALVASLVEDAGIRPGDRVLDIGAGTGIVAAELAARGARVDAVEVDEDLVVRLSARFDGEPNVRVLRADARRLRPPSEPFSVVANLPFDGATAILRRLLDDPRVPLERAVVVLEWRAAAKRAAVWPSTALGAYWSAWHELELLRRLPRCSFAPPPSVDAGVLGVRRRARPLVPIGDAPAYRTFLERCFASRPRDAAPARTVKRLAGALGFDANGAARDLDARQLAALFGAVRGRR